MVDKVTLELSSGQRVMVTKEQKECYHAETFVGMREDRVMSDCNIALGESAASGTASGGAGGGDSGSTVGSDSSGFTVGLNLGVIPTVAGANQVEFETTSATTIEGFVGYSARGQSGAIGSVGLAGGPWITWLLDTSQRERQYMLPIRLQASGGYSLFVAANVALGLEAAGSIGILFGNGADDGTIEGGYPKLFALGLGVNGVLSVDNVDIVLGGLHNFLFNPDGGTGENVDQRSYAGLNQFNIEIRKRF